MSQNQAISEKSVDLQQRDRGACEQLREQEIPARQRAHQQSAHVAHLAVVDHRQRGLHAVEQLDHRHQSRRDIDLVEDVGLVGRDDGDAQHLAESGGEDEQPDQRPHQRGDEALALMQEAQRLAPHDAAEAGGILGEREAARRFVEGRGAHDAGLRAPVRRMKAEFTSCAPVWLRTCDPSPCARTWP